ncbi:hypothetical protein MTP99_011699 [Tenebrio molitor]|jgi:hypothetical protein|nr:hypothetical protein MTP99_011699 [Tenebrio molitor]
MAALRNLRNLVLVSALLFLVCQQVSSTVGPCVCSKIYTPVCASDGNTYPNACTFNCYVKGSGANSRDLRIISDGECPDIGDLDM